VLGPVLKAGASAAGNAIKSAFGSLVRTVTSKFKPVLNSISQRVNNIFKPNAAPKPGVGAPKPSTSTDVQLFNPPNNGFAGAVEDTFLYAGQKIDRFGGGPNSTFFSPQGTAAGARSLPPGVENLPLRTFEVLKPIPVQSGTVAQAFGQAGGGIQFNTPAGLEILLKRGILQELF
jgi:hypothetical protein